MTTRDPIRLCAGCRQRLPVSTLVRLTASAKQGVRVSGVFGRRDNGGRGLYTCPEIGCATRALKPVRGRLKLEAKADRLAEQVLRQANTQALRTFMFRKAGLARRGLEVQDARLRAWSKTLARLNAAVPTATDSGVQ
ncbi:MAG: DUF448 domain-containing protein [Myxococcales bacterium]|nr:DUF448 domain-containing protein [Myxococcales bacterium]